ncbi:hypothetical protein VP01_380g2 [Puccinia sorghi]|uniref:Uncharacterized protein n=1 Tax=Puccinia sorghi TaxID=27349 RepID=A0A0L6UTC7_9BASI|nr:hypothetical protein VP01_380g2 [Puccinia sorghi]
MSVCLTCDISLFTGIRGYEDELEFWEMKMRGDLTEILLRFILRYDSRQGLFLPSPSCLCCKDGQISLQFLLFLGLVGCQLVFAFSSGHRTLVSFFFSKNKQEKLKRDLKNFWKLYCNGVRGNSGSLSVLQMRSSPVWVWGLSCMQKTNLLLYGPSNHTGSFFQRFKKKVNSNHHLLKRGSTCVFNRCSIMTITFRIFFPLCKKTFHVILPRGTHWAQPSIHSFWYFGNSQNNITKIIKFLVLWTVNSKYIINNLYYLPSSLCSPVTYSIRGIPTLQQLNGNSSQSILFKEARHIFYFTIKCSMIMVKYTRKFYKYLSEYLSHVKLLGSASNQMLLKSTHYLTKRLLIHFDARHSTNESSKFVKSKCKPAF